MQHTYSKSLLFKICLLLLLTFITLPCVFCQDGTTAKDSAAETQNQSTPENNATAQGHVSTNDDTNNVQHNNKDQPKAKLEIPAAANSFYNNLDSQKRYPKMLYKNVITKDGTLKGYSFPLLLGFIIIWGLGTWLLYSTNLCRDQSFDPKSNLLRPIEDRPFSYSRVQLFWWTSIILSCFVSFYFYTGYLAAFTPTMVLLLGEGLAVSIFGKVIDNSQIEQNNAPNPAINTIGSGPVPIRHQDIEPTNGLFRDILSDEGGVTIHRFQAIVFNVVFGLGFITSFLSSIKTSNGGKTFEFPFLEFEDWQLTLLGVSAASYLGFKANENSKATKLERQIEAAADPNPPATSPPPANTNTVASNSIPPTSPSTAFLSLKETLEDAGLIRAQNQVTVNGNAQKIIDACNNNFNANKGDCNKFAIAVAAELNIPISGLADNIVDEIQGGDWTKIKDGIEAKQKADEGWFVVGGLKAADTVPSPPATSVSHGHVVIVTTGPLAKNKYPTAVWGSMDGVLPLPGKDTVNWAWNKASVDKVIYAAKAIG